MNIDIKDLGISADDIADRVADQMVDRFMNSREFNDPEDEEVSTAFKERVEERVQERLDAAVDALAAKYVAPDVETFLEDFTIQETNKWGEKKGEAVTFVEYLTGRADAWLREPVDHNGKTKSEDSFGWRSKTTRIAFMIDKHLQYSISTALKNALDEMNKSVAGGLRKAVEIQLAGILEKIKVDVKTGVK